ncbi:hypothetical protein J2736_000454 [Paenibacillus qinlingensis]|uniref:Uncharacterized protein n=1 Tax=Paenibacillus qinlingensis TaxID=1837343 RepID=A0ABU1NP64_9BACL|nr:hypothetical protein [Paenibacillus qinlingensis]
MTMTFAFHPITSIRDAISEIVWYLRKKRRA